MSPSGVLTPRSARAAVLAFAALALTASAATADPSALLIFDNASPQEIRSIVAAERARVLVMLPEASTALVHGPAAAIANLVADPRVKAASESTLTGEHIPSLPEPQRVAAAAWNRLKTIERGAPPPFPATDLLIDDSLEPQAAQSGPLRTLAAESGREDRPYGANWDNTSEFLGGEITLTIFLLESDGSVDSNAFDWTMDQESQVLTQVMQAASNLDTQYRGAIPLFTVHMIYGRTNAIARTGTEPINRGAVPGGTTGEDVWVREVLGRLGYADPYAHRTVLSRRFADAQRLADGTDWAVNIFIAHTGGNAGAKNADADGKFADGRFGYAYLGGPHVVMTYANGGWGISRMSMVLFHELHHSFFVLDESYGSGCSCAAHAGYLDAFNDNCQPCLASSTGCTPCPTDVTCAMRSNDNEVCDATRRMVGAWDTDADGTPDVQDLPPQITLAVDTSAPQTAGQVRLTGTARIVPYPSRNPGTSTTHADISILRLVAVEVSLDDGLWSRTVALPADGAFDGFIENYAFELMLAEGQHKVAVRAIDTRGHYSDEPFVLITPGVPPTPLATPSLTVTRDGTTAVLGWDAIAGAARYTVRRTTAATVDAFLAANTTDAGAALSWSDVTASPLAYYRVYAVDTGGTEYPAPGVASP